MVESFHFIPTGENEKSVSIPEWTYDDVRKVRYRKGFRIICEGMTSWIEVEPYPESHHVD